MILAKMISFSLPLVLTPVVVMLVVQSLVSEVMFYRLFHLSVLIPKHKEAHISYKTTFFLSNR